MGYRTIKSYHHYTYTPQQIWDIIVDPIQCNSFQKDPCCNIKLIGEIQGKVGDAWMEIHTDEECLGDEVVYKRIKAEEYKTLTDQGSAIKGLKQRINVRLQQTENGCMFHEEITFSPSFKGGSLGQKLLSWIFLGTGLLGKFAADEDADAAWYQNLESALKGIYGEAVEKPV